MRTGTPANIQREIWNKGKVVGQKPPLKLKEDSRFGRNCSWLTVAETWRYSISPLTANFALVRLRKELDAPQPGSARPTEHRSSVKHTRHSSSRLTVLGMPWSSFGWVSNLSAFLPCRVGGDNA